MKISIITINFNNYTGLSKTINSVLCQSFDNIEYIIIDGGSVDASVSLIKRFEDRISYWVSEPDNGVYHAMNKGILHATGKYLLFLNSGDTLVAPDVLEKMLCEEDGSVDLLYGDLKRNFPDGTTDEVPMPPFVSVEDMLERTLCHPVTLIHHRLFKEYGLYDERLKIVADWAFFLKVIVLGNASQKHKNVLAADFAMDGMSSLPENQDKLNKERDWVKATYFSPAFLNMYEGYTVYKKFYFNKFLQPFRKAASFIIQKLQ